MPKLKTVSGVKKRFRVRPNGSVKRRSANRNHILTKKANKRMRRLRAPGAVVRICDKLAILKMLCKK